MSAVGRSVIDYLLTGDPLIDGILGTSGNLTKWGPGILTYSFPFDVSDYGGTYGTVKDTFAAATAGILDATFFALDTDLGNAAAAGFSIEGFTLMNFDHTADAGANIRSSVSDQPNTAFGYYPSPDSEYAGDIWYGTSYDYSSAQMGNYRWLTALHEIGHAMELKHAHEFNVMPAEYDRLEYTVMSYKSYQGSTEGFYTNAAFDYPQTYMMYDIAALQHLYGADYTANAGDTVYTWNPNSGNTIINGIVALDPGGTTIFGTIWDGGGNDTFDLSAYTTDMVIDLMPGSFSNFGTQIADVGNFTSPNTIFAQGNIYNALLFEGNTDSLIENVYGGSGNDMITGNAADNLLSGGDGNDTLIGGDGDDSLWGGAGSDIMTGGAGNDTFWGGAGGDTMTGGAGDDFYLVDEASDSVTELADEGNDVVFTTSSFTSAGNIEVIVSLPESGFFELIGGDTGTIFVLNTQSINSSVQGGAGADTVYAHNGTQILLGGGADVAVAQGQNNTITGGEGDDIYIISGTGNVIVEADGGGADTVYSYVSYIAMGNFTETLALVDPGNLTFQSASGTSQSNTMIGNGLSNIFFGGAGGDFLIGGGGDDLLKGGTGLDVLQGNDGADQFVYDLVEEIGDVIQDWVGAEDSFAFNAAAFGFDVAEMLVDGVNFFSNANPFVTTDEASFLWDTDDTVLYYDPDGSGDTSAMLVADLQALTDVTVDDFVFV